jgi:hypothetical protein
MIEKDVQKDSEEDNRTKRRPTGTISRLILLIGIIFLSLSFDYDNRTIAFIGTNLILIGATLFYSRPVKFVRSDILNSMYYQILTNSGLIKEMGYEGEPFLYSPRSIWGLNNVVTIIPKKSLNANNFQVIETNEVHVSDDFIQFPPSGIELLHLYEGEYNLNFTSLELTNFSDKLDEILINGLNLVKNIDIKIDKEVEIKLLSPVTEAIINAVIENDCIPYGDPLLNSLGCILAKITGKRVSIKHIENIRHREFIAIYHLED